MDENKINDISKNEGQIIIEKKKDTTDEIKSKDYVNKTYSKRIICELVKSENNKTENELAIEISEKVNNLVDMILNHSQNKFYCILFLYKCLNEEFFTKNDSNNNIVTST